MLNMAGGKEALPNPTTPYRIWAMPHATVGIQYRRQSRQIERFETVQPKSGGKSCDHIRDLL